MKPLKKSFFMRDTCRAAEQLLGCYLIRKLKGQRLIGRIVETEAYLGIKDPSCHSFKVRRTERSKTMYLPGGHSYIYFIYGMHHCFNAVTLSEKEPEAVLIRAIQPLEGLSIMRKNRKKDKTTELCSGPGKLCQAMDITKALNGQNLCQEGAIYIAKGGFTGEVETDSRAGLPPHEDSSFWLLRFYIKNSPFVSLKKNQIA